MDYTEKYELDVKIGNRIGRRLRALGSTIAKRGGKIRTVTEPFDHNAFDGDGDGIVQDGSQWERPVTMTSQVLPSEIEFERSLIEQDENRTVEPLRSEETLRSSGKTKKRRTEPTEKKPKPGEASVYEEDPYEYGIPIPTPPELLTEGVVGVSSGIRDREKELREKDHRIPGSTADMTPEELADLAVREPSEESTQHAIDQIVGHPSQYANQAEYEKMRALVEQYVKDTLDKRGGYDAIKSAYDGIFGAGAFDEDAHRNRGQLAQRMKEMLGDGVAHSLLLGTGDPTGRRETLPELDDVAQSKFIDEQIVNPNIPPWKRDVYKAIKAAKRESRLYAVHATDTNGATGEFRPQLNPIHAFFANIFAPTSVQRFSNGSTTLYFGVLKSEHELDQIVQRPWNSQQMTAKELMIMVSNDYLDWAVLQKPMSDRGITRDGSNGNLPSPEQIERRFNLAAAQTTVFHAMNIAFPGQARYEPFELDGNRVQALGLMLPFKHVLSTELDGVQGMPYDYSRISSGQIPHSSDPVFIATLRAAVLDMLLKNPMVLEQWREKGVPTIRILHPISSGDWLDVPDDIQLTPELISDDSAGMKQRIKTMWAKFQNAVLYLNENGHDKHKVANGKQRDMPLFLQKLVGNRMLTPQSGPMYRLAQGLGLIYDMGNDPTVVLGAKPMEGIGGSYTSGTGMLEIDPLGLLRGAIAPVEVFEGIVNTGISQSSMKGMGSGSTIFHEWVHFYHDLARYEVMRILRNRRDRKEQELIQSGVLPADARQQADSWYDQAFVKHGGGFGANDMTFEKYWDLLHRSDNNGTSLYPSGATVAQRRIPMARSVIDFTKFADYGFASQEEMEDEFLRANYELRHSGYQQGGLLEKLHEDVRDRHDVKRERKIAANAAKQSAEPYTRTAYGQTKPGERVAEASVGAFMRQFRNFPFMNNDVMIRLLNLFFMRRDKDGPLEETHGITTIQRRKKKRGVPGYHPETEPLAAISTIRAISPSERRGPDGHRPSLRSAGRVSAVQSRSLRFDPDERSRLRSGASNIGMDTDERLYAFDSPVTVSDFSARTRTLSIGDHRFQDIGIPYAQSLGRRRRATLGYIAGRVFVNRNKPHDGDMMRAISATQFGMFVDDLPTYDVTTENDRAMLRALVSGRIAELPRASRNRIENAVKNATHIHSAVQDAIENKHELYRVVRVEPRSFVEGLIVGERVPMPITSFTRSRPSVDAGQAVIRIQRGAKAIDVDDGHFLTQGTFEVVALDMVDGQVTATLKHVETYDPRHDAMRPVDRFSDKPGAMRKFGSPRPRYTREEQQRMEVDLARRKDKAEIDERMYGLRSTGASGLRSDIDAELDVIAETTAQRAEASRQIIAKALGRIRVTLNKSVNRRLDLAREGITKKYGGARPWVDDAGVIRRYASYDPKRRHELLQDIFSRIDSVLQAGPMGGPGVNWTDRMVREPSHRRVVRENFYGYYSELSLEQLDSLLGNGRMLLYYEGLTPRQNRDDSDRTRRKTVAGYVDVELSDEEREMLQSIRDMLAVGERAYLIDDNGQSITTGSTELIVRPRYSEGQNGSTYSFRGRSSSPYDAETGVFKFYGKVLYDDVSLKPSGGDAGYFTRSVYVSDGELVIRHDNMYMTGVPDRGAATILNQHAFQWWKQIPGTRVTLMAAMDGPIVWPRHGFHPKDLGVRRFDFDEQGVDFSKLIAVAEYIVGALSNDQDTRKRAYDSLGDIDPALIQARLDRFGARRRRFSSSSLRDNVLSITGFGDKTDADISESDAAMRERIGLWLALAIQDRLREPGVERKATLVLLANLLDTESMEPSQKNAWKELFRHIYSGDFSLELDGVDNDPDYLPSFVIHDEDPTASIIARRTAIAEERERGAALDMLVPRVETGTPRDIIDPGVITQEQLNLRTMEIVGQRLGRLNGVFNNSRDPITGNTDPTLELVHIREATGGEQLPRLIQPYDATARLRRTANYGQNVMQPWNNQNENTDGVILVGITQDSRARHDGASMIETVRNFLTSSRTMRWDEEEDSFLLDPIFTTTPDMYTERFADPMDPTVDPATNKVALLGVADKRSRWATFNGLTMFGRDFDELMNMLLSEEELNSPWSAIDALKATRIDGENLLKRGYGGEYKVNEETMMSLLDRFFPQMSKNAKDDMYSVFGMFADHLTFAEIGSDRDKQSIKEQASWLFGLISSLGDAGRDSRRRQTAAILLGYDFLSEHRGELGRSRIHVLNRGALTMVDEAVSLSDIARFGGMSVTPRNPGSLRSGGRVATTMMLDDDGAPTLLRFDDPLGVTATEMSTHEYTRLIRQDYGINPPSSLRSGGGNAFEIASKQERAWFVGREERRKAGQFIPGVTPEMYAADIQTRMERYAKLEERIQELEDQLSQLDTRYIDLDNAGELTQEIDKEIDDQFDAAMAEKLLLEMQQQDIADTIASDINTLNEIMDMNEQREGLAFAIRKFLSEQVSLDIPEKYREELGALLADLETRAARGPSTKDIKARHKILSELLDDDSEFDIRWHITRDETSSYTDDFVEGVDLEDFEDDFEWAGEKWLEWIYRSFFDPSYEEWRDSRMSRAFEKQTEVFNNLWRMMGMEPPERGKSPRRQLEDMIDNIAKDITRNERSLWSRQHDEMLRNEYNADYEEAIIDATPADSSAVPRGVPERIWKKIVASARLARRTPYEGEREAAVNTAKRLLTPHRPDLVDDDYILSLRSRGAGKPYPMISGVNLRSAGLVSRGSAPDDIRVPKPDRFHSRLVERLSKYGVKDEDLAVDGKYGSMFASLLSRDTPFSIEQLEKIIDNPDESVNDIFPPLNTLLPEPITAQDQEVLKEIIKETAKIASQSGWGILEIEGHRVKKINGAYHEELVDVLVDEVDLAMIRAMGAPTYERITKIHAVWARNLNRLNKMFGAYESRGADGAVVRVGSDIATSIGAYNSFLGGGDAKIVGYFVEHRDMRGNLVMTVSREYGTTDGRITSPRQMILQMGEQEEDSSVDAGTTNDAIMEAMFNAVGIYDYTISSENDFDKSEPTLSYGRSLSKLKERLAKAREQAEMISFSPTPAGRHMEEMFLNEIKWLESHIQMYERIGQRFVKLLQESEGLSKDEVGARLKILANKMSQTNDVFTNGSPATELADLSMYELALSAFNSMRLASRNVPRITDGHIMRDGTHEIGHFIFGQAFTRHGEYMSNLWPYVTMGPEFWNNFVRNQERQSVIFDRMTIQEGLGLKWTAEQRELYKSLSDETKEILRKYDIVNNNTVAPRRSDAERFRNDIIEQVRQDPTLSEIEKAEIITSLQKVNFHYEMVLNEGGKERLQAAIDDDLTPDVMRALGIDPLNEENPHVSSLFSDRAWNRFVRIEPSDLGWQRTSASGSSLRSSGKRRGRRPKFDDDVIAGVFNEGFNTPIKLQRELEKRGIMVKEGSLQKILQRLIRDGKINYTIRANAKHGSRDAEVIRMVREGYTLSEMASAFGVDPSRISKIIKRLRRDGVKLEISKEARGFGRTFSAPLTLGAFTFPQDTPDELTGLRRVLAQRRLTAYQKYKNNLASGMSREDAVDAFLVDALFDADVRVETERTTKGTEDFKRLMKLLEILDDGIPKEFIRNKGPAANNELYVVINEMKLLGFSNDETSKILNLSPATVNKYRQMHYRAYRRDKQASGSLRSGGLRSSGPTSPSTGQTPLTDNIRTQLGRIRQQAKKTEQTTGLDVVMKNENEFTVREYNELESELDMRAEEFDLALEELVNEMDLLQLEQDGIFANDRINKQQSLRLDVIEARMEEIEEEKAIVDKGHEAVRLARMMIRQMMNSANRPRGDGYINQYTIIRDARGDLVGMTLWGWMENEFDFLLPGVGRGMRNLNPDDFPPEQRTKGRSIFVDFLVSFQTVAGTGSYLFSQILRDSKGRNVRMITLETTPDSIGYWEQLGFAPGGYRNYHDLVGSVDEMVDELDKVD